MRGKINKLKESGNSAEFTTTDGKSVTGVVQSHPLAGTQTAVTIRSDKEPTLHYLHIDHIIRIDESSKNAEKPEDAPRATITVS